MQKPRKEKPFRFNFLENFGFENKLRIKYSKWFKHTQSFSCNTSSIHTETYVLKENEHTED